MDEREEERAQLLAREQAARVAAEAMQRRLRILAEASSVLASSLDYETTLDRVAQLAVPELADGCVVDLLDHGPLIRRIAVAHEDPSKVDLARAVLCRYPPDLSGPHPLARVLRTGEPEVYREIPESLLIAVTRDEEHLEIARRLGLKSALLVPLRARGRILGALTLVTTGSFRSYGPEDVTLAEELARRAALAIDNARLHHTVQAAEQRFRSLSACAPIGIFETDREGRVLYCNARWLEIAGLTAEESLGDRWTRAILAGERDGLLREWSEAARGGQEYERESRIVTPEGVVRWAHIRATPIRSEEGELTGYVGTVEDVSERKWIEDAFRQLARDYQGLFENAHDAIVVFEPEGEIVLDVNPAACELYGLSRAEFVGMSLETVSRNVARGKWWLRKTLNGENRAVSFDTVQYRKDGSEMFLEVRAAVVEYRGRRAILSINRDVTERRKAEEALRVAREEEHRFAEQLTALHEVCNELSKADSLADLCRAAVELGRSRLGFDRMGIWLVDQEPTGVRGSFGVDEDGGVRDERGSRHPIVPGSAGEQVLVAGRSFVQETNKPVRDHQRKIVGRADQAMAALWDGEQVIGYISTDNLLRRQPITGRYCRLLKLYASALGHLCSLKRTEEALKQTADRLNTLSRQLVAAQERERREIARELHDEVGQLLTGLKLSLEIGARSATGAVPGELAEAMKLVNELTTRVREMALDLRPAMLDDLGLLPALLWHVERYTARTGVSVNFDHTGIRDRRFGSELETAAYRIVQEGLTNVARHAGVREATVRLRADARTMCVQIEDRGAGFSPEATLAAGSSSGLAGMRERVMLLGGVLAIEAAPGAGARLTAELPLNSRSRRKTR